MGKKKKPVYEKVEISNIGAQGKAIARVNDLVVFVSNALPGDVVDIRVGRKRKSYQEGRATHFHKLSDLRTEPFCEHFKVCGGCKWQDLQYTSQLKYKEQEVRDALVRIGHLSDPEVRTIVASRHTRFYRNKLEFTFSNRRWLDASEIADGRKIEQRSALGFHAPGMYDKVVDLENCYLQAEPSNSIRRFVRTYAREHGLSFSDPKEHTGFLRTLVIRNTTAGEVMVILVVREEPPEVREGQPEVREGQPEVREEQPEVREGRPDAHKGWQESREALLQSLHREFPEIDSLMYVINPKMNDTFHDLDVVGYAGKDHINEEMDGLTFRIGPKSFFQTNSYQALELYRRVREYAALNGKEVVYDLYTGTGTIANYLAGEASRVIGFEYIEEAVADARINSEINGIDNTMFVAGDIKDRMSREFIAEHGTPDVLVTDPPRAGMHARVVQSILEAAPRRIIYVSCNPATQARDIALLSEKYSLQFSQPFDMFPHTYHVENLAVLDRIN